MDVLYKAQSPDKKQTFLIPDLNAIEFMSLNSEKPDAGTVSFMSGQSVTVQASDVSALWNAIKYEAHPPVASPGSGLGTGTAA